MNPKRSLMIVDDEEGPRQSLSIVFKDDYNNLLADSVNRASELAKQHSVDAAVLDIRMSGMSGVELLGKLKEIDSTIEVIMLTAYETIETARQALRLGACDYLTKPFDISTMRAAIASAMDHHLLSEEIRANNDRLRELQGELQKVHPSAQKNELVIRHLPEDVVAEINGTDMIQILLNLTINALQCGPEPHRVEVYGQRIAEPLDLSQFVDGPEDQLISREELHNVAPLLAISVQDNGPGISPEVLPKIFEPFFTTKSNSKDTG